MGDGDDGRLSPRLNDQVPSIRMISKNTNAFCYTSKEQRLCRFPLIKEARANPSPEPIQSFRHLVQDT
jgi:hypothetical protein